jgi:tetratricopeptide (TPR) repeat protein
MMNNNLMVSVIFVAAWSMAGCSPSKEQKLTNDRQIAAALDLSHQNKYSEAAEMLKKVISLDPRSFEAFSNLGSMYVKMNKHKEAIEAFEKAKALRPGASVVHYNIGGAYLAAGELDKAEQSFSELDKKFPKEPDGKVGLALVAMEQQKYSKAIGILEEVGKNHPNTIPVVYSLAVCYSVTGNAKKAEEYKSQLTRIDARYLSQLEGTIKLTKERFKARQ